MARGPQGGSDRVLVRACRFTLVNRCMNRKLGMNQDILPAGLPATIHELMEKFLHAVRYDTRMLAPDLTRLTIYASQVL